MFCFVLVGFLFVDKARFEKGSSFKYNTHTAPRIVHVLTKVRSGHTCRESVAHNQVNKQTDAGECDVDSALRHNQVLRRCCCRCLFYLFNFLQSSE